MIEVKRLCSATRGATVEPSTGIGKNEPIYRGVVAFSKVDCSFGSLRVKTIIVCLLK
ncbi:MAG: hypothetical protein ACTTJY_05495 [Hoylesella shahii]|uniref:hypothetical protein n=1 Tax=Hoylesella shahii TaxID=228603 RepID=UPI003FA1064E